VSTEYRVGDRVQLVTVPSGPARGLRLGQVGTVLVAADQCFRWLTVQLDGQPRPRLLRPQHLARVAAAEVSA
jgi:hypothetical protein